MYRQSQESEYGPDTEHPGISCQVSLDPAPQKGWKGLGTTMATPPTLGFTFVSYRFRQYESGDQRKTALHVKAVKSGFDFESSLAPSIIEPDSPVSRGSCACQEIRDLEVPADEVVSIAVPPSAMFQGIRYS